MKLLFTHSYFLRFDPKQWKAQQPFAPLGTLYAAALMRENDYDVSLFDVMFCKSPEEVLPCLASVNPDIFVVYDDGFNYLTKMCLTNMRDAAIAMIGHAKKVGCKVLVSSSDSTDHYEKYLDAGADFVLIGEAEQTLLELGNALKSGNKDYVSIHGLAYRSGGSTVKTTRRNVITQLDNLPLPAWDLVDIDPYRLAWMKSRGFFSMNMSTTRGCPFKCNWCAKPIYGNRYHSRSPENVLKELTYLKEKFEVDYIWFCDDIFGLKPGWIARFSELLSTEKLEFKFKIQSRADLLLQEDSIRLLKEAGCDDVWIGAESGSQKILDAMDKGTTVAQIYEATRLLKRNGIKTSFFIQFGYPGETWEDISQTIRMITELLPHDMGISVSYPLPGTLFHERVKAELGLKANWTDSDELQLMFKNTFSAQFYKQLYRFVHQNYRLKFAMQSIRELFSSPSSVSFQKIKKSLSYAYYLPSSFYERRKLEGLWKEKD